MTIITMTQLKANKIIWVRSQETGAEEAWTRRGHQTRQGHVQVVSPDWSRTVMPPSHWPSLDRCQAGETRDTIEDDTDTEGMKVHKSDDG